jgi:hypothetical protein
MMNPFMQRKMKFFGAFSLVLVLICSFSAEIFAQQMDLLERIYSGSSKEATPQAAKNDIQNQAAQKISEELIKEFIGEDRFVKNKIQIQNKIIKNSARYLPFSKPSNILSEGEGYKMSVTLRVSVKDLKQMLQDQSLLSEHDSIPVVLPMITVIDKVQGRSFQWWMPADRSRLAFLFKQGRALEDALRASFQAKNFYVLKPIEVGLAVNVPRVFQNEKNRGEVVEFFAQFFNAPVVIDGQVVISKEEKGGAYRIDLRMTAIQVSNSRPIADVSRHFTTEVGAFEMAVDKKLREVLESTSSDLASQVFEVSQKGSLGTSVIRITIQGTPNLPYLESLKEKIRSQITQVKNMRERMVAADSISYEIDTSVSMQELAQKIESFDFNGVRLSKISAEHDEVVFKLAK